MKRLAAILSLAGALAIGVSSSASAKDPAHVNVQSCIIGFCANVVDVSVRQIAPGITFYTDPLCPPNEIRIPFSTPVGDYHGFVAVCEQ